MEFSLTWSLALQNGDLALGPGNSLAVVTDQDKVTQDILCRLLEPFGDDPMNPTLGSFIDSGGGVTVSVAGNTIILPSDYQALVTSEVNRVITTYMNRQRTRIQTEITAYGGSYTLTPNEIINSYSVDAQQVNEILYVNITLSFVGGNSVNLQVPVSAATNTSV